MREENQDEDKGHPYTGKYVLIRTYASGVHIGVLKEYDTNTRHIYLTDARRIWSYEGAFTLSAVAMNGVKDATLSMAIAEMMITQVEEIIPLSEEAEKQLREWPTHEV